MLPVRTTTAMRRTRRFLLVADAPVGREQNVEAGLLRSRQQCAVAVRVPALGLCGVNRVSR
jgi:hypothetical protein